MGQHWSNICSAFCVRRGAQASSHIWWHNWVLTMYLNLTLIAILRNHNNYFGSREKHISFASNWPWCVRAFKQFILFDKPLFVYSVTLFFLALCAWRHCYFEIITCMIMSEYYWVNNQNQYKCLGRLKLYSSNQIFCNRNFLCNLNYILFFYNVWSVNYCKRLKNWAFFCWLL